MLYNNYLSEKSKKIDFLFESKPYNQDIDIKEIAAIQVFYENNGYIPDTYISKFLNWLTYAARMNISAPFEDIMESSMAGKCAVAQTFFDQILDKMGFTRMTFNVGDVVGTDSIHALTCVQIPTRVNGVMTNKLFMLDPTFRQFCTCEENRFERYYEEPKWNIRMSTPHPGYFFNLTNEGREFANNLIHYGYFEVDDDSLKQYFDPFVLFVTPKESYKNCDDIGKIHSTTVDGKYYWNRLVNNVQKPFRGSHGFDMSTPKENIEKEKGKLGNRIKRVLGKKELDEMFVIDDVSNNVNSSNNKVYIY